MGTVLSQINGGDEHPILYLSRKIFPREKNYATVEKVPRNKMGPGNTQILPSAKEGHSSDTSFSIAMDG